MSGMSASTIVVTGASRGIGEAIYRRLVRDGYAVVGTYNASAAAADKLARELGQEAFVRVDMTEPASVDALIGCLRGRDIKALINNAGMIEFEDFSSFDMGIWRRSFAVHCESALRLATELADDISSDGSIVNIASTDAYFGGFDTISYAASKAALASLTRSLAVNLGGRGIRVNAVAPGWIDTDMGTEFADHVIEMTPLRRLGRPDDIAGMVSFLVSGDAAFVTGQTLVADGGYYLVDPVMKWEAAINKT
jgi:NAD(P)-dependent dehydrogenase (short-subunit alcohol dehydrogenase family)